MNKAKGRQAAKTKRQVGRRAMMVAQTRRNKVRRLTRHTKAHPNDKVSHRALERAVSR